jgi:quercetin dioxygenase-like cupin family protein
VSAPAERPRPATYLPDLAGLAQVQPDKLGHHTAMNVAGARVIVLAFAAGATLADHRTPFPLLLQALDGHLDITADGQRYSLRPGALLHLDASVVHAVEAREPSRLCLFLLGAGTDGHGTIR